MTNNILVCDNLLFKFSRNPLFSNVSLKLDAGTSLSIAGKNGCGKTTLLKILAGLLKPYSGTVHCYNEEIWPVKKSVFEHKSIYLAYTPALFPDLTIVQNIEFYLNCYGKDLSISDLHTTLAQVKLEHKISCPIRELSSGQKRRVILAVLLLLKPQLVFLDEPTNGLDSDGSELCLQIFEELQQTSNTSFIIATHDKNIIEWSSHKINLEDFLESFSTYKKSPIQIDSLF